MRTRNNPTNKEQTGATSLAAQGQGADGLHQAVSPMQQQRTIMDLISGDLESLSQEGKTIVRITVKALTL
ncbi:hypothetical protein E2C01_027438 [Portunus trituberculatus]|uniref:Uncharacterized protein n=1 Tax=Portunus trituberculatus TaxID=210409 RepID=A0A5B7ELJ7_PORTR|nr:hypothetical protein [Portunus trituberculatus]